MAGAMPEGKETLPPDASLKEVKAPTQGSTTNVDATDKSAGQSL